MGQPRSRKVLGLDVFLWVGELEFGPMAKLWREQRVRILLFVYVHTREGAGA